MGQLLALTSQHLFQSIVESRRATTFPSFITTTLQHYELEIPRHHLPHHSLQQKAPCVMSCWFIVIFMIHDLFSCHPLGETSPANCLTFVRSRGCLFPNAASTRYKTEFQGSIVFYFNTVSTAMLQAQGLMTNEYSRVTRK